MYGYCLQLVPEEPASSETVKSTVIFLSLIIIKAHDEMDIEGEGGRTTSLSMVFTFKAGSKIINASYEQTNLLTANCIVRLNFS